MPLDRAGIERCGHRRSILRPLTERDVERKVRLALFGRGLLEAEPAQPIFASRPGTLGVVLQRLCFREDLERRFRACAALRTEGEHVAKGAQPVSERGLREAVLGTIDWQEQRRRWEGLKGRLASIGSG